jgi:hypothetical protein
MSVDVTCVVEIQDHADVTKQKGAGKNQLLMEKANLVEHIHPG